MMQVDTLWTGARLATMAGGTLGIVDHGAIAARDGRIAYAGPAADLPMCQPRQVIRCDGRWITPGLVDCHTHLVHAGDRSAEFEQRLAGATYEQVARAGGGIASTVAATRAADEASLTTQALRRLDPLIAEGVTTVEVKSGYGLDRDTELRMLRAARALGTLRDVRVRTTFLGAHAMPPRSTGPTPTGPGNAGPGTAGLGTNGPATTYPGGTHPGGTDKDAYIDAVCRDMLPAAAAAGLVDAVDAFCEGIAFSPAQVARVFAAAAALGLPVKLHADQLSNLGGATLAARHGALSADHLEYANAAGVAAMAASGTVAVLLPGAAYFIRERQVPPIALFRQHRVPMAVATDSNPGTSPLTSLLLAMNMAATLFRLTVEECLRGATCHAARALGLQHEVGTLQPGLACDLAVWDVDRPAELVYRMGLNPLHQRVRDGLPTSPSPFGRGPG